MSILVIILVEITGKLNFSVFPSFGLHVLLHFRVGFSSAEKTWLPINPNYETLNVLAQSGTGESHLATFKAVSKLRKTDAWRYGSLETKAPDSGAVFGFSRYIWFSNLAMI
jgi:hypothetical protein